MGLDYKQRCLGIDGFVKTSQSSLGFWFGCGDSFGLKAEALRESRGKWRGGLNKQINIYIFLGLGPYAAGGVSKSPLGECYESDSGSCSSSVWDNDG
jgi:hypothetical protein